MYKLSRTEVRLCGAIGLKRDGAMRWEGVAVCEVEEVG